MIRDTDYPILVASSCAAGLFSGVFTNVLEVIKTRIMNEALLGSSQGIKLGHLNKLRLTCKCYSCLIRDMFKKEGIRYAFRGVGYNTSMSMMRSAILFPLYEFGTLQ
jgi:Mitochondrial carrier protein